MGPLGAGPGRRRAAAVSLGLAALLGGCAGPSTAPEATDSAFRTKPLGRSESPRSGHLTWRLGAVDRVAEGELRIDLHLHNATHRSYRALRLRVTVHGPQGERQSVRVPLGGLRDGQTRPVSARFASVSFAVRDVTLALIYALP